MTYIPVTGFENRYLVNDQGVVVSLWGQGRALKPSIKKCGYAYVALWAKGANKPSYRRIHRLVADAFVSNPEGKPEVNHIDGNKLNNCASNLEWVTRSENAVHGFETGLMPQGKDHPNTKLEPDAVIAIFLSHGTYKSLAAQYGVAPQTVANIKHRRVHKRVLAEIAI